MISEIHRGARGGRRENSAVNPMVLSIATSLLGAAPSLVRAPFFDKTPQRNWFVAWLVKRCDGLN
jgi:hypothetical protein